MIRTRSLGSTVVLAGLAIVWLSISSSRGQEPEKKELTAREILDRVAKAYADCDTYRDTGEVSITFFQETGDRLDIRPFRTAFVRDDRRFRFQYTATDPSNVTSRYLIWRGGDEMKTWWDIDPGVKTPESLALAIAGATGVSGGSAHTVPSLLLPKEVGSFKFLGLAKPKRLGDDKLEDIDCYRIEGIFGKADSTFWIDKKTSMILKIISKQQTQTLNTEIITTYKPVIGEKVPEADLVFDPPKPKDE